MFMRYIRCLGVDGMLEVLVVELYNDSFSSFRSRGGAGRE